MSNPLNQMESEANNSQGTADPVVAGKVCGMISPSGDQDWYSISLPGSVTLSATMSGNSGDGCGPSPGTIDSEIEIRSSTAQLIFNEDISTSNYCGGASYFISAAGTYYIRAASSAMYAPTGTFSYCITITAN
jgi:hypothetical protein